MLIYFGNYNQNIYFYQILKTIYRMRKRLSWLQLLVATAFLAVGWQVQAQNGAPHTFTATDNYSNVTLNWVAPNASKVLQWHNNVAYNGDNAELKDSEGMGEIYVGSTFSAEDLKVNIGEVIDSVAYYQYRPVYSVSILLYENKQLVYSQDVPQAGFVNDVMKKVALNVPYTIKSGVELMVAIKIVSGTNLDMVAIKDQASTKGKGDWYSFDGKNWSNSGSGDYLITAYIKNPNKATPTGYNVYRNDQKVNSEPIADTNITLENEPNGTNTYKVSALYDGQELSSYGRTIKVTSADNYFPAVNGLKASVSNLTNTLSWNAPLLGGSELGWTNKVFGNSIGGTATTATKVWVKNAFGASDLFAFNGGSISAINVYFKEAVMSAITLFVMENGTIIYSEVVPAETVSAIKAEEWTALNLTIPVKIEPGNDYAYGFYCLHTAKAHPISVDNGVEVLNKSNEFSVSSPSSTFNKSKPTWKTLTSGSISGSWMMTATITDAPTASYEVDGYDVYRNGELASSVTAKTYSEDVTELGNYTYAVVAKGKDKKESPKIEVNATVNLPKEYRAPMFENSSFDSEAQATTLNWNMDVELKHYGSPAYKVGFDEDISMLYGTKFTADEFSQYSGYVIKSIRFCIGAAMTAFKLDIYSSDGTLLGSENIDGTKITPLYLYTYDLSTPITIPEGKDIIIAYNATLVGGTTPIILDAGPLVDNGAIVSLTNGASWMNLGTLSSTYKNYNIAIGAIIGEPAASGVGAKALRKESEVAPTSLGLIKKVEVVENSDFGVDGGAVIKKAVSSKAIASVPKIKEFVVYRNEEEIGRTESAIKTYIDKLPNYGEFSYNVTAVYSNGWESPASSALLLDNFISQKNQAPYDLKIEAQDPNLTLSWQAPEDSKELNYQKSGLSYAVGMTGSGTRVSYCVSKFPVDSLVGKENMEISHIKFWLNDVSLATANVIVMYDYNIAFEQPIDVATLKVGENIIRLNRPMPIKSDRPMMVGYHITYANGIQPMTTDAGPSIDGFSNLLSSSASSTSWKSLKSMNAALDYSWRISAVLKTANSTVTALKSVSKDADVTTYNVYFDNKMLATGIKELTASIAKAQNGDYAVSAVKNGVETATSNVITVKGLSGVQDNIADKSGVIYDAAASTLKLGKISSVKIYSASGSLVKEATDVESVDMSAVPNGAYLVRINGTAKVVKFLK